MRVFCCCLVAAALAVCAPAEEKKPSTGKAATTRKKSPPPKGITIPAGAEEIEPGLYRHREASGQVWLYRYSPFGVVKFQEQTTEAAPPKEERPIKVEDLGDTLRFQRQTPFGPVTWTKKKTELTEDEMAAWKKASQGSATEGQDNTKR